MLSIDELKATYAKFSDFKLSKLLGEIDSLTPEAQQVLKAEVEKRNLVNIDFAPISAIEPSVVKEKKIGVAPVSDRFFNYLIDMGAFMAFGILFFVYGDPILSSLPPKLLASVSLLILFGFPILNFVVLEGLYGKTIGKFVTKTTVVKLDGTKIGLADSLIRAFGRLIPFVFMDESMTLHDKISQTYVKVDR